MIKISNIPFTRTFNSPILLGKELMLRVFMMTLFIFSTLAFLILEKKSASISELVPKSFLLLCLACDLDLSLLNCQPKKSLLKLLFALTSMPRLIFKYFVKLSANIAVLSLVRWRPSFQTISLPISSLHKKLKLLVARNTFSMLFTIEMT